MKYLACAIAIVCTGCVMLDETLIIAGGLATIQIIDNRPRVRVSTGVEECKWRARGNLNQGDYAVHVQCRIPTDDLIPRGY